MDGDGNIAEDEVYSERWADGAGRSRRSRTEHPGSTGGWKGSLAEYDILGRVKRSTVPTEINSSYTPAGDDAARGWLWKHQKYDWKGRVVRTINTDGIDSPTLNASDQLISYEGCGCAGGEVVTVESELVPRDDMPNVNARRKQKTYSDILGRNYKSEVLNWDGSVYTTTVHGFNGRDQATQTRQYAGTSSASVYQDVTMAYDGHGRMKTRHYPIEDASANTTWSYNADGTAQMVIDPRGAITNFTYEPQRGLLTNISYSVPNGSTVPVTPSVAFSYNNLGMKTQMQDGTGTTAYNFDALGRMESETKTFAGISPKTISYTYEPFGGLKSVTDPFGSVVNYSNDKAGMLTAVSGTPWAQNTTGSYANNIKYRSFGNIKQMDFTMPNETAQIKMEYDNRLRVNHFEIVSPIAPGGYHSKADFSYFADSRTQTKDDLMNNRFDRTMKYDFAGRLKFNQFPETQANDGTTVRVYEQTIHYDAFSNMTYRTGEHWGDPISFGATYVNGRSQNQDYVYDAAGNIIQTGAIVDPHSFQKNYHDAAGRQTLSFTSAKGRWGNVLNMVNQHKNLMVFDGEGRPLIEKEGDRSYHVNDPPPPSNWEPDVQKYQVWSSVLGSALSSFDAGGNKLETRVFAGNTLIARQKRITIGNQATDTIEWATADPVTESSVKFEFNGGGSGPVFEENEPLGQKVSVNDPTSRLSAMGTLK